MIVSSSDIHWEGEKINRWNLKNRSLPSSIAKVYEDTKIGRQTQTELQTTIDKKLFIQCIPDCESCNGYVMIADTGHRYICGCIHHTLLESKRWLGEERI
jgi:ribosomal protein S27AE